MKLFTGPFSMFGARAQIVAFDKAIGVLTDGEVALFEPAQSFPASDGRPLPGSLHTHLAT